MATDFARLHQRPREDFALHASSIHGFAHWQRVETFGLRIAGLSGGDPEVVRLFACLHDARRVSDGGDPRHGERAAALARELRGEAFARPIHRDSCCGPGCRRSRALRAFCAAHLWRTWAPLLEGSKRPISSGLRALATKSR